MFLTPCEKKEKKRTMDCPKCINIPSSTPSTHFPHSTLPDNHRYKLLTSHKPETRKPENQQRRKTPRSIIIERYACADGIAKATTNIERYACAQGIAKARNKKPQQTAQKPTSTTAKRQGRPPTEYPHDMFQHEGDRLAHSWEPHGLLTQCGQDVY